MHFFKLNRKATMKKQFFCFLMTAIIFLDCCALMPHRRTQQSAAKPILTGWLTQQQIFKQIQEYQQEKNQYQPAAESLEQLAKFSTDVQIVVFLGTWCSDSQREVPRFLKIMELAQNPHLAYKLLGLDRSKRDAGGLAEQHQIEFVPTFVVLHEDKEIGRIVETPVVSIEQDLVEILAALH